MAVFGSKKTSEENASLAQPTTRATPKGHTAAKGAPTPRRKDVEARNRRPLVSDTKSMTRAEKRARKAEERARSNELYQKQQQAMRTGDQRNMPHQHKGPVRAWGRDYVDASAPISAFFMPVALLLLPLMFFQAKFPQIVIVAVWAMYAVFLIMLIHGAIVARRAKKLAAHRFGEVPSGFFLQMFGRAFYLRRWRLPAPQVCRGEFPKGASRADLKEARAAKKAKTK